MNKEELLKRLDELNTITVLSKKHSEEYRNILNDLEQMGVPPLSQTLENESDKQTPLSSISDKFLSIGLFNSLTLNDINTVGAFLDLNRLDTLHFTRFGPKKWLELYPKQKLVYDSLQHTDLSGEKNAVIPNYTLQELIDINREMLEMEFSQVTGQKWDKNRYQELMLGLQKRNQKRSDVFADDELGEVPVEVASLSVYVQRLTNYLGVQKIVQLFDVTESDVLNVPSLGKKAWSDVVILKNKIINSQKSYVEKFNEFYLIRELPDTTEELPLYKKCILAITQLKDILESWDKVRDSFIVNELFIKGSSIEDVTGALPQIGEKLTRERVRQISEGIKEKIMAGSENTLIDNAYFSDGIISELNNASQELLYCPLSYANEVLQAPAGFDCTPILRLLDLTVMDVSNSRKPFMDAPRIIQADDSVAFIASHLKAVYDTMNKMALPASKDDIISQIMNSAAMSGNCDINVLEKILAHHSWIEKDDNQAYSFIYSKLGKAETKAARIVYEKKKVTTADIQIIDAQKMQVAPEKGISITASRIIRLYPWVSKGAKNNEVVYTPAQTAFLPSLRVATELYAKEHIIFKFDDMVNDLKTKGYSGYADGSFRAYVLKCCVPSNKDGNLLCLESEIQNHDPGVWRSRTVQGTTNFVVNSCVKILGDKRIKKAELNRLVLSQPEAESYNVRNIYSVYLINYCCNADNVNPNKLFILDGEYIQVNKQCLDEGLIDLENIGSINRQPDYYMDVLTEIVNQLKQAQEQRMTLVQLRKICSSLITHPSKTTVFYKITNKLPDEVEKVEIDGVLYLQLKKEKLAYEKTYSLPDNIQKVAHSDGSQVDEPEVVETTKPEKVYIRGKIDWDDMAHEMKRELEYYNRWWDVVGVTLDDGIDKFVSLLRNSQDGALHNDVSRHIYEFLTQKLDRFDLHDHMKSIVLGAEPIIRSIYMHNNSCSSSPKTKGLSDCLALIPDLQRWVDDIFAYQSTQKYFDFRKTYLGFFSVRNKIAHGVSIEMNTGNKYLATYGYLALFVYIYCRFVKK